MIDRVPKVFISYSWVKKAERLQANGVDVIDHSIWQKLISRNFCERIFSLFGVKSIDSLKQKISKCKNNPARVYDNVMIPAPPIQHFINIKDIGTLP